MKTYQDFLNVAQNENARMHFIRTVINEHKASELYRTAAEASEYMRFRNSTISRYRKIITTITGQMVDDPFGANYKIPSRFFNRFVTQENQHLLGNGVTWDNEDTSKKLGARFDTRLQILGKMALWGGVAFGYFNFDHLEAFSVLEFAPLYDEEDGSLKAGVRFWQIDNSKPLRATLYEMDGVTEYIWGMRVNGEKDPEGRVLKEKRAYKERYTVTPADGMTVFAGENYPSFPIIPLWGSEAKQSELVGLQEGIDCYDLIKSGYANNVDEGSLIYWTLKNAGGMQDADLVQFVERMKTLHAAASDGDAQGQTMEAPYMSREALLSTLRSDLYEDAMALDTKNISNGAVTATQIEAAYEPLNSKCDEYEYCVRDFLDRLLELVGIEDNPTFTRSTIVNRTEEIQSVILAAPMLDAEYVMRKILTLLGDGDLAEDMLTDMVNAEMARNTGETSEDEEISE